MNKLCALSPHTIELLGCIYSLGSEYICFASRSLSIEWKKGMSNMEYGDFF